MKYGVVLVVVSILMTVLLGGLISGEDRTTVGTDMEYITDIGGLWSSTPVSAYDEYTPSTAYTAYTSTPQASKYTSGITYTFSTTSKSVPVAKASEHTGQTETVALSDYAYSYKSANKWAVLTPDGDIRPLWGESIGKTLKLVRATPIVNYLTDKLGTDNFTITLSSGSLSHDGKTYGLAAPILVCDGDGEGEWSSYAVEAVLTPRLQSGTSVFVSHGTVTYLGETHPLSETYFLYGAGSSLASGYTYTSDDEITARVDEYILDYMDITQPVYAEDYPLYLNPGYTVGRIDFLIRGQTQTGSVPAFCSFGVGNDIYLSASNGMWKYGSVNLGKWDAVYLSVGLTDVTVWGVKNYTTMKDYALTSTPIYTTETATGLPTTTVTVKASVGTVGWQVQRTDMDVGAAAGLMGDAKLEVRDYWPDLTSYAVDIGSVAVIGTGITVGPWHAVCDQTTMTARWTEHTETVDGEGNPVVTDIERVADLSAGFRMTLMPDGTHVIRFVPYGERSETEATVPGTGQFSIQLDGPWAVSSDLFKVWETVDRSWEWQPGMWDLTAEQAEVLLIIIAMAGVVVLRGLGKKVTIGDWAVLVSMIAIAWVIV